MEKADGAQFRPQEWDLGTTVRRGKADLLRRWRERVWKL